MKVKCESNCCQMDGYCCQMDGFSFIGFSKFEHIGHYHMPRKISDKRLELTDPIHMIPTSS